MDRGGSKTSNIHIKFGGYDNDASIIREGEEFRFVRTQSTISWDLSLDSIHFGD